MSVWWCGVGVCLSEFVTRVMTYLNYLRYSGLKKVKALTVTRLIRTNHSMSSLIVYDFDYPFGLEVELHGNCEIRSRTLSF